MRGGAACARPSSHLHRPGAVPVSPERVEMESRKSHIPRLLRYARPAENQPQPCGVLALDPRSGWSNEETLQASVPLPDDRHSAV